MLNSIQLEILHDTHVNELSRLANDPRISTTSGVPPNCDRTTVTGWLTESQSTNRSEIHFTIKADKATTGCCILKKLDLPNRNAELAYWVGVEYWGNGIATAAAALLRDLSFSCFGLEYLYAHYLRDNNQASAKILAKLGFTEDQSQADIPVSGRFSDLKPDVWTFVKLNRSDWLQLENIYWSVQAAN